MAEPAAVQEEEENSANQSKMEGMVSMSRKEKRKAMKKMKRKQMRKEIAEKEREEEEARINDPEEQERVKLMEQEEAERAERDRMEFVERERLWMEEMEKKKREEEEEEERRRVLKESQKQQVAKENELNEDDDWEYEEGPAEIIWQGNEIIVRKKKVKVAKKDVGQQSRKEDSDRPTSNPLPPQSEAFADYKNASLTSAQQVIENAAQQVPNFGTEQDKSHCPFHLKTGACRFGQRCSRAHFYPDKSCTLLIKNMYNGPGLAWEQDEGLEYTDEEVERCYEEFYEDVHTEFLKFGEIVNFKVCKNGSFHLRGNVYVHYESLDSAVLAYHTINGRYFAGKQVTCEFVNLTRWKIAICGEYMKSRLKTCSHGTACNFIHCFRNPGGDYEWADWDKPPPRYWVKKMAALFGYSDESGYEKQMEQEYLGQQRKSRKMITADIDRRSSRRSRSRVTDCLNSGASGRSHDDENDVRWRRRGVDRKQIKDLDDHSKSRNHDTDSGGGDWSGSDTDRDRDRHHDHTRKNLKHQNRVSGSPSDYGDSKSRTHDSDTNGDRLDRDGNKDGKAQSHTRKSSRWQSKVESLDDNEERKNRAHEADGDWSDRKGDRETHHDYTRKRSRHGSKVGCVDYHHRDKSRSHDTDSVGESSHRVRNKDKIRSLERERSGHHNMGLEFPDDRGGEKDRRTEDADSSDDWSDRGRDRHSRQTLKGSRHPDEESEFSDDQGEPKKLKEKNYTREYDVEKSNLQIVSRHNHSGRGGSSSIRHKSKEKNEEGDRWEPEEHSPGKHQISRRKITHSEIYEPSSPGHSDGKMKSHDVYSDENVDSQWESKRGVSGKHKSRRKVASSDDWKRYSGKPDFRDQNSGDHRDKKMSRGSSRSSSERHS